MDILTLLSRKKKNRNEEDDTDSTVSDKDNDDDDEDDVESIDLSNQDWRTFRAKLVMGSTTTISTINSSNSSTTGSASIQPNSTPSFIAATPSTTTTTNESAATNSSRSNSSPAVEDLDGIGAIFASEMVAMKSDEANDEKSSNGNNNEYNSKSGWTLSPLDPSQWAYESGTVIEQGAVILGGVEQDYGFGLRQQYFHKAAILVLDHDENTFTKGIILNRPTDLMLDDTLNPGVQWQVWYGGDVQGLASSNPEIVCLHTLKDNEVARVSIPVMNDIQWTTFDVAKQLVRNNLAKSTDFWVFCGYAGWGPKQLMGELERKSWYMVATDAQTLLKELARLSSNVDPRDAGLETWSLLMHMIGRAETAEEHTGDFDDCMLKEWALKHLLSVEAGGGAETNGSLAGGLVSTKQRRKAGTDMKSSIRSNPLDRILQRVATTASEASLTITAGTVVRASSMERSPFLLDCQELHKSIVLILSDDENLTVGVILNRPGAKGLDVRIQDKINVSSKLQLKVPLRYGGQFAIKGTESLLWLHCNPKLKSAKIGTPIGENTDGIWKCSANDMISVVGKGLVKPDVFVVVAGVSVWMKGYSLSDKASHGMQGEIRNGNYEFVPEHKVSLMFDKLIQQEVLTEENLNKNLIIADQAWAVAESSASNAETLSKNKRQDEIPIGGLGEGYDEEDDTLVYKTDVKVAKLCDDALRSWVATFLLGAPSLGE
jgi:putative AlgH/UPF0301 family transcriptional regulator